jgi:hypothetical protein
MPRSLYDNSNPDPNSQWTIDPTTKQWVNVGSGQRVEYGSDRDHPWRNLLHVLPYLLSVPAAGFGIAALTGGLGAAAAGGAGASGAGTGATGAAGGVLPSSSYPVASLMGGPAAIASQGASRGIPWGGAIDAGEDYLGGRRHGGGLDNTANHALDTASRLSPLLQSAISALAGLPALLANNGPSAEERALYDQARQMQALQQKRIEHQNPLFSAVTQLAMSRLPGASQQPLGNL